MAKRTITQLIDDLDGSEATESMTFGVDGALYEIDLSGKNATRLRKALAPYQEAGVRLGRIGATPPIQRSANGRSSRAVDNKDRNKAIREWADEQGLEISDRGRIPQIVVDAYDGRNRPSAPDLLKKAKDALK